MIPTIDKEICKRTKCPYYISHEGCSKEKCLNGKLPVNIIGYGCSIPKDCPHKSIMLLNSTVFHKPCKDCLNNKWKK